MNTPRLTAIAFGLDVVWVVVFCAIGRRSHDEAFALVGFARTLWPFLVGMIAGWIVTRATRAPSVIWPTGIGIWLSTVVVGMVLRAVSGQGVVVSFVIVATIFTGLFAVGWRAIYSAARRKAS